MHFFLFQIDTYGYKELHRVFQHAFFLTSLLWKTTFFNQHLEQIINVNI